ncbi:MAG TPA: GNAT family protein [Sedimentisphaerales bacterium]|nr:GNAT family protein [Sedimentisphaerales bacterium]
MRIELGEYVIRDLTIEDASAIVRYANNRKIAMWLRDRFPYPYTAADANRFLAAVTRQDPRTVFAIATQAEVIGGIGLEFRDDVHRYTAELGYWLGEPFWGRGVMTEAVRRFAGWAFENLEVHRICVSIFDGNDASVRVLEKAGFQREGRLRAAVFKNGRILDQLLYAKIKDGIQ